MQKRIWCFIISLCMFMVMLVPMATAENVSGTFEGEGSGYGGKMTVAVTLSDGTITKIEVTEHNETEGIGTKAFEVLIPEMIDTQNVAVDAVSGCTRASNGLIEAVENALTTGGVNLADYRKITEQADHSGETVSMQKDIVIVGAGFAGMTAASYAREGGADVLVLEKMASVGGAGAISSGATDAHGSAFLEAAGVQDSAELLKEDMMSAGHQYNQEDLVDLFISNTGETFDWLVDLGIEYSDPTPSEEHSVNRVYLAAGGGVSICSAIEKKCEDAGVEIMKETTATELITEDDTVVGVRAKGKDGTTYEVMADSVVLATGGYGANADLLTNALADIPYYGAACSTGDGQIMAREVGAKLVHMDFGKVYPGGWEYEKGKAKISLGYTLLCVQQEGSIIVNSKGVRTFREGGYNYEFKNAIKADANTILYLLLDSAAYDVWKSAAVSGVRGNIGTEESIDAAVAANGSTCPVIYHADTISELAQAAGMDANTLQATVDKWNGYVESGTDEEFGRTTLSRTIGNGPYYLIGERLRFATTLGGVQINASFEVYDESDQVIPGLYAIGEVCYGVNGDDTIQGTPLTWAISSGRLLGRQLTAK